MRNLLITSITILFVFSISYSQESLSIGGEGIVKPVVVEVENKTAEELYNKALNWVQETYSNPDAVLKAQILNEKIRVNGFMDNAWTYNGLSFDMSYNVEVSFKDGRYRLEFIITEFTDNGKAVGHKKKHLAKEDGSPKFGYKNSVITINESMNNIAQSFYNYVTGATESKSDDW